MFIRDIEVDPQKNIWLALDGNGILRTDPKVETAELFSTAQLNLNNGKVYSIHYHNKALWLATNAGLNKFSIPQKKIVATYFEQDGLSNNIVYSVTSNNDKLWMSTNRGITCFTPNEKRFETYLNNDFFMDDAFFVNPQQQVFYGGYNGIVVFDPSKIVSSNITDLPTFESFALFNQLVNVGDTVNDHVPLKQALNQTKVITLPYYQHTFTFGINCLPFDYPNTYKYRYRLFPWQKEWISIEGTLPKVSFTNVRPHQYTLQVQVAKKHGQWSETKNLAITITPPFWETWWFLTGCLAATVCLVVLLIQLRLLQIKRRNKWLTEKVREQTKDLQQKNTEIQDISAKLHEADQARLRFFTNVSHEFRTPLTVILGYIESLETNNTTRIRKVIQNNAIRLLRLVNQLIEFRKLDLNQLNLQVETIELNSFIQDVAESFKVLANRKNIELVLSFEQKQTAWLDADKLDKIIHNLISNAIKYSPEGQTIYIRLTETTNTHQIEVIDEGIGISPEDMEQVFTRFFRSGQQQSKVDGHGIGLALVKELTEIQLGTINLTSEPERGTCFVLSFKKGKDHFTENDFSKSSVKRLTPIVEATQDTNPNKTIAGVSILLVEDNTDLLHYLHGLLSPTYEVATATNGQEGLVHLEDHLPDLIISDIMMPIMDGLTFCQRVKENNITSHIPFILLTAKTDKQTKINGFLQGIDDYIEKPFSQSLFLARVQALLQNRSKLQEQLTTVTATQSIDKEKVSRRDLEFWEDLNKHIQDNLSNPEFTMEQLSQLVNMSRSTFYRKFKSLTGESAGDYLRKIRLHKAAELLTEQKLNVNQVALEVGFASISQFRSKFRATYGVNPSSYVPKK